MTKWMFGKSSNKIRRSDGTPTYSPNYVYTGGATTSSDAWADSANYFVDSSGWKHWVNPDTGASWIVGGTGQNLRSGKSAPEWTEGITSDTAPSWWKGLVPTTMDEETTFYSLLNALIPYASPEDQKTMANLLYQYEPTIFPDVTNETFDIPVSLSTTTKDYFTSTSRGEEILSALGQLATATNTAEEDMGTGYRFLKSVIDVLQDFGGTDTNKQTRSQYVQQLTALSSLYNNAPSDAYKSLAEYAASPTFSAGKVVPITTDSDGNYIFGSGNKRIY